MARCTWPATTTSAAGQARRMERAEARVMRRLGLPNPWKEGRAPALRAPGAA
jgi:hypothetical protein